MYLMYRRAKCSIPKTCEAGMCLAERIAENETLIDRLQSNSDPHVAIREQQCILWLTTTSPYAHGLSSQSYQEALTIETVPEVKPCCTQRTLLVC